MITPESNDAVAILSEILPLLYEVDGDIFFGHREDIPLKFFTKETREKLVKLLKEAENEQVLSVDRTGSRESAN
jgi:hypothetical protein